MTTIHRPTTTRRFLGYASGGLNGLLALGFIVVAASSDHLSLAAATHPCAAPSAAAASPSCGTPLAAIQTPAEQPLREFVMDR